MSHPKTRASRKSSESITQRTGYRVQKSRSPPCMDIRKHLANAQACEQVQDAMTSLFACPFAKRYPHNVSRSCLSGWSSIARLKEHLHRKHKRPPYCRRCMTEFKTDEELAGHQRERDGCSLLISLFDPEKLWLSPEVYEMLSRRSKKGEDPAEAWKYIYSKIFGIIDMREVPSPYFQYLDDPQHLRERIVRDFAQRLITKCRRTFDTALTTCGTPTLTADNVVDIILGTTEEFLKGESFGIYEGIKLPGAFDEDDSEVMEVRGEEYNQSRELIGIGSTSMPERDMSSPLQGHFIFHGPVVYEPEPSNGLAPLDLAQTGVFPVEDHSFESSPYQNMLEWSSEHGSSVPDVNRLGGPLPQSQPSPHNKTSACTALSHAQPLRAKGGEQKSFTPLPAVDFGSSPFPFESCYSLDFSQPGGSGSSVSLASCCALAHDKSLTYPSSRMLA